MSIHPELIDIEKQADGWVKKYVLTYKMPDGTLHEYHCATRRDEEDYRAGLERNGKASREVLTALKAGEPAPSVPAFTPDAVCIVARTPRDTIVMEREFRYPLNSWCIALPAGLIDPGESVLACADRELQEETGYAVVPGTEARILPQAGYSSTGLTDETVQVVFVEAEKAGDAHTEGSELIEVFELPIADIGPFMEANRLPIGTRAQLVLEALRMQCECERPSS